MKKKILVSILIIVISFIIFTVISIYPKTIQLHAQGIKYRLGADHIGDEQTVEIEMDGTVYTSLIGNNKRFEGTITIEGEEIPVPENQRQLEIRLGKDLSGVMLYPYMEDEVIHHFWYGTMFVNRSFSEATFTVMDQDLEEGSQGGHWDGGKGFMISVPASDRAEAIRISNRLMNKYLDGYILK